MGQEKKNSRYDELFPSSEEKAAAFDRIAEHFYNGNFGQMSKGDLETLMFHLYIERILAQSEEDFPTYSDFRLSKELGISQSRVSSLKVKKQLQYPHKFDWKKSIAKISWNARYEQGKIKIQIPDINLYYEIKNAVEEDGGYIEVTLTSKLLQISPGYFLDLLVAISEGTQREVLKKTLRDDLRKKNEDQEFLETAPLGRCLAGFTKDLAVSCTSNLILNAVDHGILTGAIATIARNIVAILPQKSDEEIR